MDGFLDRLVEGSCGEPGPVMQFVRELSYVRRSETFADECEIVNLENVNEVSLLPQDSQFVADNIPNIKNITSDESLVADVDSSTTAACMRDCVVLVEMSEKGGDILPQDTFMEGSIGINGFQEHFLDDCPYQEPLSEESVVEESMVSSPREIPASYAPLQSLFLMDPQFTSHRFAEQIAIPIPFGFTEHTFENLIDAAEIITSEHGDDCTPSCGPDHLIEVQNPTWEFAIYSQLMNAVTHVGQKNADALEDFSAFFTDSLQSKQNSYEFFDAPVSESVSDALKADMLLMNSGKMVEAIPLLEQSAKDEPANLETWTLLALGNYLNQNDAKAVSACKKHLSQKPDQPSASRSLVLLLLATCFSNEGDQFATQAVIFQWMIENLDLTDDFVAECFQKENQPEEKRGDRNLIYLLLDICNSYTSGELSQDGTLHWATAVLYFTLGNYVEAGKHFEQVLIQNPQSPCVFNQIGACFHNLQNYERARAMQDQALSLCPGFPRALYNKALTEYCAEEVEKSLQLIASALDHQQRSNVTMSDQFWFLAARFVPKLPAKEAHHHRRRVKLLSTILARDLRAFQTLLIGNSGA